ncbi:MAG: substrate-binding domain-containing protein [Chloroflexota bacterium]
MLSILTGCQWFSARENPNDETVNIDPPIITPTPTIPRIEVTDTNAISPELLETLVELNEKSQVSLPTIDPFNLEGDIVISGSFDLTTLTAKMYKRFIKEGYRSIISISGISTEQGIQLFCEDRAADIVQTSRAISFKEREMCAANGYLPVEFPVIIDALTVVVHPSNEFVENLSTEELEQLFLVEYWSDVNPDWPNELIIRYVPSLGSGAFDIFANQVLDGNGYVLQNTSNTTLSDDLSVLHQGVSQNPYAIGFFSYTHYQKHQDIVKVIKIDNVLPASIRTMRSPYPLKGPLYLYANMHDLQNKRHLMVFMNFFLTNIIEESMPMGYFPAEISVWDQNKSKFLQSINGDIDIMGSTTVYPVVEGAYERFVQAGYKTNLVLEGTGSTAGIKAFCESPLDSANNESGVPESVIDSIPDIAMSSRRINEEELVLCGRNGRTPIGLRIATDDLAIITNVGNTFLEDATLEEVAQIFTAERWSDINARWPDEPIVRFIPSPARGEFGFFVDRVFDGDETPLSEAPSTTMQDDMAILVDEVMNNSNAIAFLSYTYYEKYADGLILLSINRALPNQSESNPTPYLLTRPLMLYTDAKILAQQPQVATFLFFLLQNAEEEARTQGYLPLNKPGQDEVWMSFLQAIHGE